jgi:hypothetical protein
MALVMDFLVKRDDLHECRVVDSARDDLSPGQALLRIDSFGLTANNITYALMGDMMSYWNFFPAEDGWGRVPMWGFASVASSKHDDLPEGVRVFGYLPPSTSAVMAPDRVDARGFVDASPHRSALPSAYNRYVRVDADALYDAKCEDQQMLLWPLFVTSFLIDDFLDENNLFGATHVVFGSASSKTALSTAYLLTRRGGLQVIGLTSRRNIEFVEQLGVYDQVVTYDAIAALTVEPTVYVDMSGDPDVLSTVHHHYGEALAHSSAVGITHWDRFGQGSSGLPGPSPTLFFAPNQLGRRLPEWGREGYETRLADVWRPYVEWSTSWLHPVHDSGSEAVQRVYLEVLDGHTDPSIGHVLSTSS